MGTRASAEGEGNRGGDRAKSERDHAEGSGRAHPHCGSTSPLWSCFVTHLCYEVPEHADEEHGEGDGDHHPVPHVGVEHPFFFCFRFEGTAGFVSDQHGGSSRRFGSGSRRERDRFRGRSQERPARPERHRRRHLQHGCHTCLSLDFLSPRQRSVWPMKSPRGASDAQFPRPRILAKDDSV